MTRELREYVVGEVAEFPEGTHRVVKAGAREIGVFNIAGRFWALPNLCPHQLGPLCAGVVSGTVRARRETGWKTEWVQEGEIVACPWHGLEYHVPTGRCLAYPNITLRSYEVLLDGDIVKVRL